MANNPKKIVDPTEAALSAIQEALKVRDDDEGEPDQRVASIPEPPSSVGGEERWHDAAAGAPPSYYDSDEIGAPAANQRAFPANDDQQSIGQVLQALQKRPARTSYFVAAIFRRSGSSAALPSPSPISATSMPRSAPTTRRWRS